MGRAVDGKPRKPGFFAGLELVKKALALNAAESFAAVVADAAKDAGIAALTTFVGGCIDPLSPQDMADAVAGVSDGLCRAEVGPDGSVSVGLSVALERLLKEGIRRWKESFAK